MKWIAVCAVVLVLVGASTFFYGAFVTRFPVGPGTEDYYYNPLTKQVYWSAMGNWFELSFSPLPGVKMDTSLKVLNARCLAYGGRFYIHADYYPEIDVSAGVQLRAPYVINGTKVFYQDDYPPTMTLLDGFDAATFKMVDQGYLARDRSHIFYRTTQLEVAHPDSFSVLGSGVFQDAEFFYILFSDAQAPGDRDVRLEKVPAKGRHFKEVGRAYFDGEQIYFADYVHKKILSRAVKNAASLKDDGSGVSFDDQKIEWSSFQ